MTISDAYNRAGLVASEPLKITIDRPAAPATQPRPSLLRGEKADVARHRWQVAVSIGR
ncbi:MAG TPA: hypothetical protein VFZ16_15400 [Hyphomicrobiaceae bacterium]|nr:hypothetical protein [Hyphomicrobiaceae bacterium]